MTSARKIAIVRKSRPVNEYVTETREGMDNIADAIRTLAGVMASVAAGQNTKTPGDQRNMAGVIFADAQERFGDVQSSISSWNHGSTASARASVDLVEARLQPGSRRNARLDAR
jgi:hypothetical protein